MSYMPPLMALVLGVSATALAADPAPQLLTYPTFELAVPHVDLETCPASMQVDDGFCRATLANDGVHVFAFAYDGDSPMIGVAHFEADEMAAILQ